MQFFPSLSRRELVGTVCVQLGWHTPDAPRLGFGLRVLKKLQCRGIVRLPPKWGGPPSRRRRRCGIND